MFGKITQFFQRPYFEDEQKSRIARILHVFLLVVLSIFSLHLLLEVVGVFELKIDDLLIEGVMVLVLFGLLAANRRGHTQAAGFIFVLLIWTAFTLLSFTNRGLRGTSVIAYAAVLATASMLLGWRAVAGFALMTVAAVFGMAYVEAAGLITPTLDAPYPVAIEIGFIFVWSAVALIMATTGLTNALRRARQSEQSLFERNQELEQLQVSLEEQVAARTRGLQQVAALSEQLNAILNFDQLLHELVNRVQASFGYYYVQVYLLDESRQNLVIAAGAGQVGQQLKAQRHHLPLNTPISLVAQAARENRIVRVDNASNSASWLPNPLLPSTQAEMVIPITLEEQVVGVLDVQSERVGGLDEGDVDILRTLANQVAVAIRNARLFEQAEQSLNEARAAQEQYMARAWHRFGAQSYTGKIQQPGTVELAEAIKARLGEAAQQQTEPAIMTGSTTDLPKAESQDYTAIVAPIKLQNQVIGNMYFHQLNPSSVHIWSEQELALVQAIADQVAQTAENLRLFDEIRDRAARERTIREITDKLRAASSLEGLVKTAAEELGQRFSAELALVEFGTE